MHWLQLQASYSSTTRIRIWSIEKPKRVAAFDSHSFLQSRSNQKSPSNWIIRKNEKFVNSGHILGSLFTIDSEQSSCMEPVPLQFLQ